MNEQISYLVVWALDEHQDINQKEFKNFTSAHLFKEQIKDAAKKESRLLSVNPFITVKKDFKNLTKPSASAN